MKEANKKTKGTTKEREVKKRNCFSEITEIEITDLSFTQDTLIRKNIVLQFEMCFIPDPSESHNLT